MKVIELWDSVPGYEEGHHHPTLEYYPAENKHASGTVIIFPGGGYARRAPHEGEGYAKFLNEQGMSCFVLQYRVAPTRFPYPLLDARRAVRYVRANAEKFGIDKDKIAVMGSSAGGHLAALISTYRGEIDGEGADELDNTDCLPNAQILCYPVTDMDSHNGSYRNLLGENAERICEDYNPIALCTADTPQAFIWHTETDKTVKVASTYKYASRLRELDIRHEMHIYPTGWHGMGIAADVPAVTRWASDLAFWLKFIGFIDS
ncbi:MAG: alpha/beta hydrolase [Ruminococcaceae bacterium]|nr:alpha/beta hydrolase [Oscillospiraceae bacterium]